MAQSRELEKGTEVLIPALYFGGEWARLHYGPDAPHAVLRGALLWPMTDQAEDAWKVKFEPGLPLKKETVLGSAIRVAGGSNSSSQRGAKDFCAKPSAKPKSKPVIKKERAPPVANSVVIRASPASPRPPTRGAVSRRPQRDDATLASQVHGIKSLAQIEILKDVLGRTSGKELVCAKKALLDMVASVTKRIRLEGGDPLLESMVTAAMEAVPGCPYSRAVVRSFLSRMEISELRLQTDEIDPRADTVRASCEGTWRFWGCSYNFAASETKSYQDGSSDGSIHLGGLGFFAEDAMDAGHFDEQALHHESKMWVHVAQAPFHATSNSSATSAVGAAMGAEEVALRMACAGLDILSRKKAKGSDHGVGILDTIFACVGETLARRSPPSVSSSS